MNQNEMKINAIADCYRARIELGQSPQQAEEWIRDNANTGNESYDTSQIDRGIERGQTGMI